MISRKILMDDLWRSKLVAIAIFLLTSVIAAPAPQALPSILSYANGLPSQSHYLRSDRAVAQEAESGQGEVSTDEIEKYVSVYKAMQRNRSMTVDQAAAAHGLTTKQFRELEDRIERDDAALQQARDELQAAAQASPASRGSMTIRP